MAEMRAGYKQTDIGVIPEDWDIKSYGEIFDFLSTISNSRADLCFKGDFGYIHYGDIHTRWENTLDLSKNELPELRREKIKKLPASLRDGDLVMADASEDYEGIAKTVEVKNIGEKKVFSGLHTFLMRDRNAVFSDGIRGYIQEMPVVRQQIQKVATGLKVFGVSKNTLKNVQIPVPKPEEQKQIAAALSDVDGLIESLSHLIAKKRDMKTAAMQQLLTGKKRLPGFDGEWKKRTLGELGDCIIGLTYSPSQIDESGTLVLRSSNIQNGVLKFEDNVRVISKIPEKLMVRQNDILVCVRNGSRALIGKCALINQNAIGMTFGAFMSVYRSEFGSFIFYQFQSDVIQEQINKNLGATINQITNKTMRSFEIDFPEDENERHAIVSILSDMDSEIDTLEQRLDKARSLKTGMMQELLTGKTRLIKTNKKQEAA
ncbi:restriction endonuclease subunit S [Pseudovibrio exalbescens]|uniref:restriction endonuclease subunit S n=1 Tax=Pseudovibrio exalbescens TaxID=197461 RepID=UPI0023656AC5|nr:restriction endonuclease subunit S [Pseudovibrio exalbescens]MDD7909991.1 restriction endonuclease subunit S [Pseudovibrio exalbescens]